MSLSWQRLQLLQVWAPSSGLAVISARGRRLPSEDRGLGGSRPSAPVLTASPLPRQRSDWSPRVCSGGCGLQHRAGGDGAVTGEEWTRVRSSPSSLPWAE